MGTKGSTEGGWLNSPLGTEAIAGIFANYNKVNASDLEQLKNAKSFKIKVKKQTGEYKVGDILQAKFIVNNFQSEPPSFIVIDEKLGGQKYPTGGRGWSESTSWFERIGDKEATTETMSNKNSQQSFLEKNKKTLLILLAVVVGYFAYKKFKK
jgi:hypothetical protein